MTQYTHDPSQFGLLDDKPRKLSRSDDPVTSQSAAMAIFEKLPQRRKQTYYAAKSLGGFYTSNEIAAQAVMLYGGMQDSYRRRCTELVNGQWFVRGSERRCSQSGQVVPTYKAVAAGG